MASIQEPDRQLRNFLSVIPNHPTITACVELFNFRERLVLNLDHANFLPLPTFATVSDRKSRFLALPQSLRPQAFSTRASSEAQR